MMLRLVIYACLISLTASLAIAQPPDPWLGKHVFLKEGAVAKVGEQVIDTNLLDFPSTVESVKGDFLWLGNAWVQKKDVMDVEQALDSYSEQIRQNPSDDYAWVARGGVWQEKGEFNNAIKDYSEAIRLNPKNAIAYFNRGITWRSRGDLASARKDFTEAIRLDPMDAQAYNDRGHTWKAAGELGNAIRDYTEAIRLWPKNAGAYYNRGLAWKDKGELDYAIQDYTAAIRLSPKNADAYNNRGLAWEEKGDLENAINDLNEAIRLDSEQAHFYKNRGIVWTEKGNHGNAVRDYTEAIRLKPKSASPCALLAWLLATCPEDEFRNGTKAIELATTACELTEWKDWFSVDTLAAAYAEARDWDNAVSHQLQALKLASNEKEKQGGRERLEHYKKHIPYRGKPNANK